MEKIQNKEESIEEKRKRIISENKYCISCGTKDVKMIEEYTFNVIDFLTTGRLTKTFFCKCNNCWSEWKTEKW